MITPAYYVKHFNLYDHMIEVEHKDAPIELIKEYERMIDCQESLQQAFNFYVWDILAEDHEPQDEMDLLVRACRMYVKTLIEVIVVTAHKDGSKLGIELNC